MSGAGESVRPKPAGGRIRSRVVVVLFVALGIALLSPSSEASSTGNDAVSEVGGKCPADQHVCGKGNTWTCCDAHAICCHGPNATFHCGSGMHPCG